MDLAQAVHGHRWRQLIDLIGRLPGHSRTWVAITSDPQNVEGLATTILTAREDGTEDTGPDATDYTPTVRALAALYDLVAAMGGAKGVRYPHPASPLADALARAQIDAFADVIAQLTPHALT